MIKKGDKVKILSGKDKKKEGEVIEIDRKNNRAKVKGINIIKNPNINLLLALIRRHRQQVRKVPRK